MNRYEILSSEVSGKPVESPVVEREIEPYPRTIDGGKIFPDSPETVLPDQHLELRIIPVGEPGDARNDCGVRNGSLDSLGRVKIKTICPRISYIHREEVSCGVGTGDLSFRCR